MTIKILELMTKTSPTIALKSAISKTAEDIANYLMPTIVFVGHDKECFSKVEQAYKWANQVSDIDEADAEVYLFQTIPDNFVSISESKPAKTIYLFMEKSKQRLSARVKTKLRETLSVTLSSPSHEALTAHVKLMLIIRETMYRNDSTRPLISTNIDYRQRLSQMIKAIGQRQLIVINTESRAHGEAIVEFLFERISGEIKPRYMEKGQFNYSVRHQYSYHILIDPSKALLGEIKKKYFTTITKQPRPMLFIIRQRDVKHDVDLDVNNTYETTLPLISERKDDSILLGYLAAIKHSHESQQLKYPSVEQIDTVLDHYGEDQYLYFDEIYRQIKKEQGVETMAAIQPLIEAYDPMSLKTVLAKIEEMTLNKLYDKTQLVDAVAQATGMPSVTYFKRLQRFRDKPNILDFKKASEQ